MKPALFTMIDKFVDLDLDLTIIAVAESTVIDEGYAWLRSQPDEPDFKDLELKPQLTYRGVAITPASQPMGEPGFRVKTLS